MALSGELPKQTAPATDAAQAGTNAEAALVAAARVGDEVAWLRLVETHQEAIFRLAYLMLGSSFGVDDAEDVAQEAFVRAFLHLDQFDDSRPLRQWLLGIAANLARNRRRSAGRYWAALKRWWQNDDRSLTVAPLHEKRSEARELWQAVQQLKAPAQEVIYLSYFMDLSEAETATALGVPKGTVKSRLHRARKQLRAVIASDFPSLYDEWQEHHERG
ncbi:MAG TPA: RNA polymerase sigma factor [Candidatus Binatia bacterium]|jgi:RNA polymerase sigma-70 factor (ECF subfamily)|nr:RNA polymerase sigma factor [Candidatus Binatia bacterium]